jgi:iron uptake system component EfeO
VAPPRWARDRIRMKVRVACRFLRCRAAVLSLLVAATWVPNVWAFSLDQGAERYRSVLIEDIGRALAGARTLRERMATGDLDGAKQAWIDARVGWERSEVFTSGFVPDLDQEIDAWPNALHGFHGIEAKLFGANRTDAREEVDTLVAHLADLNAQVQQIPLPPQRLLNGIARLAFEMGGSKADGGESRLSGTSLKDIQSNAEGIELAYRAIFAGSHRSHCPNARGEGACRDRASKGGSPGPGFAQSRFRKAARGQRGTGGDLGKCGARNRAW